MKRTIHSELRVHRDEIVGALSDTLTDLRDGEILATAGNEWTGRIEDWSVEPAAVDGDYLVFVMSATFDTEQDAS